MTGQAAIIGGGVIGGGWAARFLLMGWDVAVYDPDPDAEHKITAVLDNARRAAPGLYGVALPAEGTLRHADSIAEAVAGADWIAESVPERLEAKHAVYAEIQAHCAADAIIASSTSGFTPTDLQRGAARPGQIIVAHPFNPVYLLPLVEVVASPDTPAAAVETAKAVLTGLGMKPLHVRAEIDAHIADRLLEAVWRESLWLVRDGVATTEEIDDAIRYGFGLRWAQMGLFESYRLAGGEAGMRHFMAQFGPCLKLPWTRLTDVPEFTEDLVDTIADQSDAQSGAHGIRALESIRDANLVAILRGLKWADWGAGQLLNAQDRRMAPPEPESFDAPIETIHRAVPLDWTDYNGHMNEAHYLTVFGHATDRFMEIIGCDAAYIATGGSFFTVETHIRHVAEVHAGARIRVRTLCLSGEGKRMHVFHELLHEDGRLLATGEHMLLHVDLGTRRAAPPADHIAEKLGRIAAAHAALPRPEGIGRAVGQKR